MWARPVRLEGRLVTLEPLTEEHLGGLRAAAADPAVWRWLSTGFDEWLADALSQEEDIVFAVVRGGEPVGSTRYLSIAPEHRRLEIGWTWLAREAWGTGVNVEFKTDERNERSRAALAALPAQFEGVFRAHVLVRGDERRDSAWYSVIADEWPAVKPRLLARVEAAVARA